MLSHPRSDCIPRTCFRSLAETVSLSLVSSNHASICVRLSLKPLSGLYYGMYLGTPEKTLHVGTVVVGVDIVQLSN